MPAFELSLFLILACYRLSQLIVYDKGPWHIFENLRLHAHSDVLYELVTCPYCIGMWWALLLGCWMVWYLDMSRWLAPVYVLGIAGGQAALETLCAKHEAAADKEQ